MAPFAPPTTPIEAIAPGVLYDRTATAKTAAKLRADFLALSPSRQRETIAYVQRLLADEHAAIARQRRTVPSPLARIAFRVYGIVVEWVPRQLQEDPMPDRRAAFETFEVDQ